MLTSVTDSGGMTHIAGTLSSVANTNFRIEFFSSDPIEPSGYGEGENFIGFQNVATGPISVLKLALLRKAGHISFLSSLL